MKSCYWLPLAVLLSCGSIAQAQPPLGAGPVPFPYPPVSRLNPAAEEAAATLREGMDKLIDFLDQEKKPNKLQVAAFLDATIAPYFDFEYMAKWIAGPSYADMSPQKREALTASLEASFLGTLASRLAEYQGQEVRYFRPRLASRGSVKVAVGILRPGSYPARLEFRLYHSADGWKVYDVLANGRSAVAYYRQQSKPSPMPGRPGW